MTIKLTPAGADLMAMNLRDRFDAVVESSEPMTRAEMTAKLLDASDKAWADTLRDSMTVETDDAARRVTINIPAFVLPVAEDDQA